MSKQTFDLTAITKEVSSIDWRTVPYGTLIHTSDYLSNLATYRGDGGICRVFAGLAEDGRILSVPYSCPVAHKYAILENQL